MNIDECLKIDPYSGDYGDGEVLFSDKIVTARKDHIGKCFCCCGNILKQQKHRAMREAYNGTAVTTRFCYDCCIAMAKSIDDNGEAWEQRIRLNRE